MKKYLAVVALLAVTFSLGMLKNNKLSDVQPLTDIHCFSQWVPETGKCYWVCRDADTGREWRHEIAC